MRSKNDVVQRTEILGPAVKLASKVITIRSRLIRIHIKSGTCNLPATHSLHKGRDVYNCSSTSIDEVRAILHLVKLSG